VRHTFIPFTIKGHHSDTPQNVPDTTAHAQRAKFSEKWRQKAQPHHSELEKKRGELLKMEDSGECCVIIPTENGVENGK
jgi:hypothetical protein